MLAFGSHITGFNFLHYFTRNADHLLLGWQAGAKPLEFYSAVMQLVMLPVQQINQPVANVALVTLSRLQDDVVRYRETFLRLITFVAYTSMPLVVFLGVMAEDVIFVVLGPQWSETALLFSVLAVAAWSLPVANTMGWLLTSLGQGVRMLKWGLIAAPVMLIAYAIGVQEGATGMAIAFTLATVILRCHICNTA